MNTLTYKLDTTKINYERLLFLIGKLVIFREKWCFFSFMSIKDDTITLSFLPVTKVYESTDIRNILDCLGGETNLEEILS